MIDLETMGTSKDSAILSIGAIKFDKEPSDTFYRVVNLKSAQRAGGKIEGDTVIWWMGQSDSARKAVIGDDNVLIETALREFANWIREDSLEGMWGNGSDFDNVVLENAYLRLGWTPPWTYRQNRCYRTIRALFPEIRIQKGEETPHHALDDAIVQARHLGEILKHIGKTP